MIAVVTRRPTRRVWAAALLATGVLATPLAPHAHAAFGACRSDPIVVLSNGVVLDLSANIDTDQIDIKEIGYTLHGPKGVTVVRSISTETRPARHYTPWWSRSRLCQGTTRCRPRSRRATPTTWASRRAWSG